MLKVSNAGLSGACCAGPAREEMGASAAWALLRRHLLSESGVERAGLLRAAAVEAILSADSRLALPAWLLQLFQVGGSLPALLCRSPTVQKTPRI